VSLPQLGPLSVEGPVGGSFRDRGGAVFTRNGEIRRVVFTQSQAGYDQLLASGLYAQLVADNLLVAHDEVDAGASPGRDVYRVITPVRIPFISYPSEWCFSQLKDAALLTLRVQREAIGRGMTLKDASAFNVQFVHGRPIFIDTLSFGHYSDGRPWDAYGQFCRHFLAPLALAHWCDARLQHLWRGFIDGVPLDLAARLLPWRAKLRPGIALHLLAHAAAARSSRAGSAARTPTLSKNGLLGLIDSLERLIQGLRLPAGTSLWLGYETNGPHRRDVIEHKKAMVRSLLEEAGPGTVWDLGSNTGTFSRLSAELGHDTVAFDFDQAVVDAAYRVGSSAGLGILPLWMDLANPTPGLGWNHTERMSLLERGPADIVLALALVHHLVIAAGIPVKHLAAFLERCGKTLIIEFIPKSDPQAQEMLAVRRDVFVDYTQETFEALFAELFTIGQAMTLPGTGRMLYLMTSRRQAQ